MFKLSDLISYLLIDTGNFLEDDEQKALKLLRLNTRKIWRLVELELIKYQEYNPVLKNFNLTLDNSYIFTEDDRYGIPDWISTCVPINLKGGNIETAGGFNSRASSYYGNVLPWHLRTSIPTAVPWKYEKPKLYVPFSGRVDVAGIYSYEVELVLDDAGKLIDVTIPDLELKAGTFRSMVEGKFLIAIGRSRRAFTYNNLPIQTDADTLVQEGKEMYDSANEDLLGKNKWWYAIGG